MPVQERKIKTQQLFAQLLDIPKGVILDVPKIVIVGDLQVWIENHRGVIEYAPSRVRIGVSTGEVEIMGEDLVLRGIFPDEILLEGKVTSICLNR